MWFPISSFLIKKIKKFFEHVNLNESTNTTEVGNNLEVDGNTTLNGDTTITPQVIGTITNGEGFTSSATAYKEIVKIGNVLWLVIEDEITATADITTVTYKTSIYSDYSHYIYRKDGTTLTTAQQSSPYITDASGIIGNAVKLLTLSSNSPNEFYAYFSHTLSTGTTASVSIRIPLVLH